MLLRICSFLFLHDFELALLLELLRMITRQIAFYRIINHDALDHLISTSATSHDTSPYFVQLFYTVTSPSSTENNFAPIIVPMNALVPAAFFIKAQSPSAASVLMSARTGASPAIVIIAL